MIIVRYFARIMSVYNSIKYTSFVVPDKQFEVLKVPLGLSNSPELLQRHMFVVFHELIASGIVLGYLDDLIVPK